MHLTLAALLFTLDPWAFFNSPVIIVVFGLVVTFIASRHLLHAAATWLHADAAHRAGLAKALEDDAGGAADVLDDYLAKNQQDVKALADPTARAAAEAHLLDAAKAEAKVAIEDALKRAL